MIGLIAEYADGSIVGIEARATGSPGADDARHLAWLRGRIGERFRAGYVLSMGREVLPFGDRITAIPISALWGNRPVRQAGG